jgi:ribonuclease BN (tRNA processing enzyme)
MKITWLGSGSAFTFKNFQSNAIIASKSGKHFLIDCGTDIRFSMKEAGFSHKDVDALWISHAHADHAGGVEWLAFCRFFDKSPNGPPKLYMIRELMHEIWDHTWKGGLESLQKRVMSISDYFECCGIIPNESFDWEEFNFTPVQMVHIVNGFKLMNSYGLIVKEYIPPIESVFFTTYTQSNPNQLSDFYSMCGAIFHDCETAPYYSRVHAHYDDLNKLPPEVKKKMYLVHYQDDPKQDAIKDGFGGFVKKGQVFEV